MEFSVTKSGLAIPAEKPKRPPRRYGPLELQDEDQRESAKAALLSLWDAADLSRSESFVLPGAASAEAQRKVYRLLGEMLLGNECPGREVRT